MTYIGVLMSSSAREIQIIFRNRGHPLPETRGPPWSYSKKIGELSLVDFDSTRQEIFDI